MKRILGPFLVFSLFVSDAKAQTPIIFQPGPGLNDGTDEGGLNGGKDVYIGDWDNITHGIEAGFVAYPISNCNNTNEISLLKFDVSSLPSEVDSVIMVIHHFDPMAYCYSNCIADFHFALVTQPWSETTVSFTSPPAIASTPFYSLINLNWDDSLKIGKYNITQQYLEWRNETVPNHGFEIYSTTVGCNNACVYVGGYTSDDTTNGGEYRPYLEIYEINTGIAGSISNNEVKIFPNPVTNENSVSFASRKSEMASIQLLSINGRVVVNENKYLVNGINQINLTSGKLQAGVYLLRIQTKEKVLFGKVIKI